MSRARVRRVLFLAALCCLCLALNLPAGAASRERSYVKPLPSAAPMEQAAPDETAQPDTQDEDEDEGEITFTDITPEDAESGDAAEEPAPVAETTDPPAYQHISNDSRVEIWEKSENGSVYFAAEIWLTDPSQIRSAFSSEQFDGPTETVEDIADRNGAVLAINGDFAVFNNGGIIIRNGEVYRQHNSTRQLLVIDANGDFVPYTVPPEDPDEAVAAFLAEGVLQTFVFGPVLVENGEAVPLPHDFFINTKGAREPRTVIAQLGPLHYLFVVVDGRQDQYSRGMTLLEVQEMMVSCGAQTAFNLDGGGSSTLYFNGNVLNRPANGSQRRVPDIVFIGE